MFSQRETKKKEDPRVRRSQTQLIEAMVALTIQKGFNDITVQEISKQAMINRATFYRYYRDKYDLLNQYFEELYTMQLAHDDINDLPLGQMTMPDKPSEGLVRMWEIIQSQAAFFRAMLGPKGNQVFIQKQRFYIEKQVRGSLPYFSDANVSLPVDMCLSCISGASIGLILWWLENGMPYSPNQMAAWCAQLSNAGMTAILPGSTT